MEYVPFGKLDPSAWADSTDFHTGVDPAALPVWVIRNGLNETDGAIDFAVVVAGGVSAQTAAGVYEDNNPYPVLALSGTDADALDTALAHLNTQGTTGHYGAYTIKLGAQPDVPVYPVKITPGGTASTAWKYADIEQTALVIDGADSIIDLYREKWLWDLLDGNTVSYGEKVRIKPMLMASTLAGTGTAGAGNGPAETATFTNLWGIALDGDGNLYVTEYSAGRIRKLTKADNYAVSTLQSGLSKPVGVAVDGDGNVYVVEYGANRVSKLTKAGATYTKSILASGFSELSGVAVDGDGNLYITERGAQRIHKLTKAGDTYTPSILAGSGSIGAADHSDPLQATFSGPEGIAIDGDGNLYIGDLGSSQRIRKLTRAESYAVSTPAGTGVTSPFQDGLGNQATFNVPRGVAVDGDGNVYVADTSNRRIRKLTKEGAAYMVSTLAGTGMASFADGPAVAAVFNSPLGVVMDGDGNLYVTDSNNNRIRKIALEE
jgi:sugar lactone lactonase YvrE